MNISKFVVLGALDELETASGYDILRFLDNKMVSNWTNIKTGSVYNALKSLDAHGDIERVERIKKGLFPTMTLYRITEQGRAVFDQLQEQAFHGLYPLYFGFKLALKFNRRRTSDEIQAFAVSAIEVIDKQLQQMDDYLASSFLSVSQRELDRFFIEHDKMLLASEKRWIQMAVEFLDKRKKQ